MANWAFPQRVPRQFLVSIAIVLAGLRLGRAFVGRSHAQELVAMLQFLFAVSIAQEPVIANAVESTGENVEEESPDELLRREGHGFLLIVVTVVPPVELDLSVFDIQQSMVGNRDSVGVAAQVVHHLLRSGEGRFGVNDPLQVVQRIEITAESLGILKGRERRKEAEFAGVEGLLQIGSITEYNSNELARLINWVTSDGQLRTDDEVLREMVEVLGFKRRGARIDLRLRQAIQQWRRQTGV